MSVCGIIYALLWSALRVKGFIEQTDINGNGSDCPDARRRSMGALMMVTMNPFFRSADELQEFVR